MPQKKQNEINTQLNLTRADIVSQGFYSCSIIILDDTTEGVDAKALENRKKQINKLGIL